MTLEAIAGAIILVASVFTALGVIFRPGYKRVKELGDWFDHFKRDWIGEEEAPGRDVFLESWRGSINSMAN